MNSERCHSCECEIERWEYSVFKDDEEIGALCSDCYLMFNDGVHVEGNLKVVESPSGVRCVAHIDQ